MKFSAARAFDPPTGHYRITVTKKNTDHVGGTARLGVSLGGKNHEAADRLFALVEWTAARFERVTMIVPNLLKHNLAYSENIGIEEATVKADAIVADWLAKHGETIRQLPDLHVYRSQDIMGLRHYKEAYKTLHHLLETNSDFYLMVEKDIRAIWDRRVKNGSITDFSRYESFASNSRNYILEELALMAALNAIEQATEVYPGTFFGVITSPKKADIEGFPASLKDYHYITVDFVKNKGRTADMCSHVPPPAP